MAVHPDVSRLPAGSQMQNDQTKVKQSLQAEDVVAAPTHHKKQVKHAGRWLNQPNLSRYSKRNIFQHLKGYRELS